jgi:hypothetical protein
MSHWRGRRRGRGRNRGGFVHRTPRNQEGSREDRRKYASNVFNLCHKSFPLLPQPRLLNLCICASLSQFTFDHVLVLNFGSPPPGPLDGRGSCGPIQKHPAGASAIEVRSQGLTSTALYAACNQTAKRSTVQTQAFSTGSVSIRTESNVKTSGHSPSAIVPKRYFAGPLETAGLSAQCANFCNLL